MSCPWLCLLVQDHPEGQHSGTVSRKLWTQVPGTFTLFYFIFIFLLFLSCLSHAHVLFVLTYFCTSALVLALSLKHLIGKTKVTNSSLNIQNYVNCSYPHCHLAPPAPLLRLTCPSHSSYTTTGVRWTQTMSQLTPQTYSTLACRYIS